MVEQKSWQVTYPKGMVKYIDYFRRKYFQYETFDSVLATYICNHIQTDGRRLCSLGSGTGRHEVELSNLGFNILGIERSEESLGIAKEYSSEKGVLVDFIQCDFLNEVDLSQHMQCQSPFDIVVLLFVPISTGDYRRTIMNLARYLAPGGLFVTDLFGYARAVDTEKKIVVSDIEVADSTKGDDFAVRMNYYEYYRNIVQWDAIYLFHDENGRLQMGRDHDILEVTPEDDGVDPLELDPRVFELLPTHRITETHDYMNPPFLYNYLIGWRKT